MSGHRSITLGRLVAWLTLSAVGVPSLAQSPAPAPPAARAARAGADTQRVVFVCEHGTVKSVVAAAHFNQLARARGLPFVAVSRGTAPDSALPVLVRNGLLADGTGPWLAAPTLFRAADADGVSVVVSFDQPVDAVVAGRAPVRHWDGTPSVMRDYATGRDSIVTRVAALVDELQRSTSRKPLPNRAPRP
ncbi:MAG: hypothetical protein JO180_09195 [Gemmatirosa sp.]|nr:hypothetical protein [Gemmatirosa sp.]